MIVLKGIEKSYLLGETKLKVLRGVDLVVKDSEMVAIQGRSGSGKSTLLHILAGLDTCDKGEYFFDSLSVAEMRDRQAAQFRNEKIGIVLQDYVLLNHRSVVFNVMLPLYFNKTPYKKMKDKAQRALDAVGLGSMAGKSANRLSGGERQRVAIARALVNQPKVLLADEPTGALDSDTGREIMALLKQINRLGTTVILVTHDDSVAAACDRRLLMKDGSLVEEMFEKD